MTWRALLGYDYDQLKAMTDAQLLDIFAESLKVTRPDRAPRLDTKGPSSNSVARAKTAKANDILNQLGFDMEL